MYMLSKTAYEIFIVTFCIRSAISWLITTWFNGGGSESARGLSVIREQPFFRKCDMWKTENIDMKKAGLDITEVVTLHSWKLT